MNKVENHLRKTARQLIKIDTEEEALRYLIDSFRLELSCDFVGVVLNEDGCLLPKVWSGSLPSITDFFPLPIAECSPKLLHQSVTNEMIDAFENCQLTEMLKNAEVNTWFTAPLKDELHYFGFCIIGFFSSVPLLDMESQFEEFGKDVAVAIVMARQKERQLKKIKGIEWISQNLSLHSPLEHQIADLTTKAGKETNADFACIYLYNEKENCFVFQPPAFGDMKHPREIIIQDHYVLTEYFPFLERAGGHQLTVPLVMDLKTIGVLYVEHQRGNVFSEDDLKMLEIVANHIATILENARLYNSEKDHKQQLQSLLEYQQALVKESVEHDNFDGITSMLGSMFQGMVILFDSFMRPISYTLHEEENISSLSEYLVDYLTKKSSNVKSYSFVSVPDPVVDTYFYYIYPVSGDGSLLGYLAIRTSTKEIDEFDQLTVDLARNICSIQFIKQKLVLGAKEQAMDSFFSQLLTRQIEDEKRILQYANFIQWNIFQPHRFAVLSILLSESETANSSFIEQQEKKTLVWNQIKSCFAKLDDDILCASHDEKYFIIVPEAKERKQPQMYWASLYEKLRKWVTNGTLKCQVLLGIGGKTNVLQDYFMSYQQAILALNVVSNRFQEEGFSFFEELGSYTILYHLDHYTAMDLFVKKQIGPVLTYSEEKSMDLFNTLHVFLQNNGNIKNTADSLYIHRSSLLYRLEKIESLLNIDLNQAEVRFNIMLAFKLYDLHGKK